MSLTSITLGVIMKLWILFILSFSAKAKRLLEIFINYILWYEHVTWPYKKMSSGQVISARFNDAGYLDWRLVRRGVSPNMQPQWISLRFGHGDCSCEVSIAKTKTIFQISFKTIYYNMYAGDLDFDHSYVHKNKWGLPCEIHC